MLIASSGILVIFAALMVGMDGDLFNAVLWLFTDLPECHPNPPQFCTVPWMDNETKAAPKNKHGATVLKPHKTGSITGDKFASSLYSNLRTSCPYSARAFVLVLQSTILKMLLSSRSLHLRPSQVADSKPTAPFFSIIIISRTFCKRIPPAAKPGQGCSHF